MPSSVLRSSTGCDQARQATSVVGIALRRYLPKTSLGRQPPSTRQGRRRRALDGLYVLRTNTKIKPMKVMLRYATCCGSSSCCAKSRPCSATSPIPTAATWRSGPCVMLFYARCLLAKRTRRSPTPGRAVPAD